MSVSSPSTLKQQRQRPRVLLGVTGSVAAVKGPEIALQLVQAADCDVTVLLTQGGANFWNKAKDYDGASWNELQTILKDNGGERITIYTSEDEWKEWNRLGDPVLHVDLRDWADICLVAPLSAHSLAKLANGLCDDTLTCVMRAWDFGYHETRPGKPCILAPAMNTAMWSHPLTAKQLEIVAGFWKEMGKCHIVQPQIKTLACGELGNGALASVDDIVSAVENVIESAKLKGGT